MITKFATVWCDVCDTHEDFCLRDYSPREYMTANGWKHTKGKDLCGDCIKKLDAKYKQMMGLSLEEILKNPNIKIA